MNLQYGSFHTLGVYVLRSLTTTTVYDHLALCGYDEEIRLTVDVIVIFIVVIIYYCRVQKRLINAEKRFRSRHHKWSMRF